MSSKAYLRRVIKLWLYKSAQKTNVFARYHLPALGVAVLSTAFVIALFASPLLAQLPPAYRPAPSLSPTPRSKFPTPALPPISAQHVFVQNFDTGEVLFQKNADQPLYPASTTKIVTGLVALRHFPLDQILTVRRRYSQGQVIGFEVGERINVENLLYALLIDSANDAAEILAESFCSNSLPSNGQSADSCGRQAFIAEMNRVAANELGLKHTMFKNPTGLDEPGHLSTAADLGRLAGLAMKNALFARIVSTQTSVILSADGQTTRVLENTNELLGEVPGVIGIKTGFTDLAGQSLITLVKRDGRTLIFVVMGSADRFGDTKKIIDWAFRVAP